MSKRVLLSQKGTLQGSTQGHPSQLVVEGRLACVMVERASRNAPEPRTWKAYVMTASRTYAAISQPVRSPVGTHMGIDRQRRIVVQTATSGP